MSEITQIITAFAASVAAVASIVALFKTIKVEHQVAKVEHEFNSKMTQFLELTASSSRAAGRREVEDEAKAKL